MHKIIAVSQEKGGEGKSTTAAALLSGLSKKGFQTLAIDLDPQGNLTNITGADPEADETALELLTRECNIEDAIQPTESGYIVPSSRLLANIDVILQNELGKAQRLKKALEPLKGYDFVIIDCPPALGTLTANALTAADYVVIPTQADVSSLQGISQLWNTIKEAREYTNPKLAIAGILLTRYNSRSTLNRSIETQLREDIAPHLGTRLFNATIRDAVAIKEAHYMQQSIFDYAPKAKVTEDYRAFIEELLPILQKGE